MTTTDDTTTAWSLPLEAIYAGAKDRIDNPDFICPAVEVWYEGENSPAWKVLVLEMPDDVNHRDAMLHAAKVMSSASGADYVVCHFDTHASSHQVNPTTGEPWKSGEMQRMCDEEGYCDTGNIRDNMVTAIARRSDGKMLQHMIPYHFHGTDNAELMFWEETTLSEWEDDATGHMEGLVPTALREAITSDPIAKLLQEMTGVDPMDIPHAQLHQILAGVRILASAGANMGAPMMFVSAIRTETEEEQQIVQESRKNAGLVDPTDDDE